MPVSFRSKNRCLVLAVSFDDNCSRLLSSAVNLCKKTGLKLRVVNVVEPWVGGVGFGIVPFYDITDSIQQAWQEESENKLKELVAKIDKSVQVNCKALYGLVSEAIITDAQAHRAALIMTGTRRQSPSILPRGYSTAVSLMGNSPIPVLAVSPDQKIDFSHKAFSLVVADDLGPSSEVLLRGAFDLADSIDANIMHVHALGISKEGLMVALEAAAAAGRSSISHGISPDEYLSALRETVQNNMAQRFETRRKAYEKDGRYKAEILEGDPKEAIAALAEKLDEKRHMFVFGRHHTFHRKPFLIGRVPFKSMMENKLPVLVIPPEYF